MNFNQLKIFYAVTRKKSFTMAARELFLTQPAVTIQIQKMEKEYETKLFDRVGKKIFLTESGKILFSYAEKILALFAQAEEALTDVKELKSGKLSIGASATVGSYYLPKIFEVFGKKYPKIEIEMNVTNSYNVVEDVLTFKNDLGFVGRLHHLERLVVIPVLEEELVLIVPPDHPFGHKEEVFLEDLSGQPFISREMGSATRELVEEGIAKRGVSVKVVMVLASNEAIKRAVEDGLGISIISKYVVQKEVDQGLLRMFTLADERIIRKFFIIYHEDKYLSNTLRAFLNVASELSSYFPLST
ncbi:MAG: selenium metabolism-associated LysR family transcriptional regulator [Thermodesulfobacteriota bacterium]|jgi:DNA-binding transcriptional LysR family regulator